MFVSRGRPAFGDRLTPLSRYFTQRGFGQFGPPAAARDRAARFETRIATDQHSATLAAAKPVAMTVRGLPGVVQFKHREVAESLAGEVFSHGSGHAINLLQ